MDIRTRAVWSDICNEFHCIDDIKKYVDWCSRNRISVTFPCINHCTGAVVYDSDVAPRLAHSSSKTNPADYSKWDPIPDLVRISKEAGIEVHLWICISHAGAANLGQPGGLEIQASGPRPQAMEHPERFIVDQFGRSILEPDENGGNEQNAFFNPTREDVRAHLTALCKETAERYDIDGIHLDYIRFSFMAEGGRVHGLEAFNDKTGQGEDLKKTLYSGSRRFSFDETTLAAFEKDTGMEFTNSGSNLKERIEWLYSSLERREIFFAWKASKVTELVRQIGSAVRPLGKTLSAAIFSGYPWCGKEVAQRWPQWVDEKLLDIAVPMDYGKDLVPFKELLENQFKHLNVTPKPATPFLAGIDTSPFKDLAPEAVNEKLEKYEDIAEQAGQNGVTLFCHGNFRKLLP